MPKFIAVIPARGGSKRFPGKNITSLDGRPLIAHSIRYVQKHGPDIPIYVSSDDSRIISVARSYHARIIKRPCDLAGDHVTTAAVLRHAVETLESEIDFDYVILLQATNPLRPTGLLTNAVTIMQTGMYDSLMTVTPSDRKLGKIIDGRFVPWNYNYGQRSQDMEPLYYENGLLYIAHRKLLLNERFVGETMYPMIVDHPYGTVDIDTEQDLRYAEFILKTYYHHE
ncbi:acylneuraminate cytidylyltransferase family protein [Alistipes indistinctus]|uniref:acylneuraminate cytidylyltransferase family protein n=1 Tax=Alistipes indistinctus TaxID=626932 RepID=UPI0015F1CBF6|nr:acylneuraminate cytidylyltransferase family protein [Alistipes indistinctus]BCD55410.1 N-acylneuraminate cytidylyltransferase [Alistipes indistinctus]